MGETIWAGARKLLQVALSEKDFETWIAPLQEAGWVPADAETIGELTLTAPNGFFRDWVRRDYQKTIDYAVAEHLGSPTTVTLGVDASRTLPAETPATPSDAEPAPRAKPARKVPVGKLPRHSFDDFIVGSSNELAYRAMKRVIQEPGGGFNPLFVYGATGLGKTHLLSSAARELMLAGAGPVALVPAETFVNEMISDLKQHRMERFRERYRRLRTLIVDDVQFFCGKTHSQEEFKQTFNALYDGRRQIILASDRPPQELELEETLRNRFASGCLVDVRPPDPELRLKLVQHKSARLQMVLPDEAVTYIANSFCSDVRQLEGALQRVYAMCSLSERVPTLALVQEALGPIAPKSMLTPTIDRVMELVARERSIDRNELLSARRTKPISEARHLAMYLCRVCTDVPLQRIGESFGGRDHTTVLHGVRVTEKRMHTDAEFRSVVRRLEAYLEGSSSGARVKPAARSASTKAARYAG